MTAACSFSATWGFCEPTAARRISFEDSLEFERIHEETYRTFGFELVNVPMGTLDDRVASIRNLILTPHVG